MWRKLAYAFGAGLWLLLQQQPAFALGTPAQTMRRAAKGRDVVPELIQTKGGKWVEVIPCSFGVRDIPEALKRLRRWENVNARYQDPDEFGEPINMDVLGPYDPAEAEVFFVPYIPVPRADFAEYLVGSNIPDELKATIFFEYKGQEYARYFIHPSKTASYEALIEKYGIVRDEFVGFPGASPRSLYVFDPTDAGITPFVAKVSLHFTIDGDLRINRPPKAARSYLANEILAEIPQAVKDQYDFDFIPEVAQLLPAGKSTATIYRSLPKEFLGGQHDYAPAYVFASSENGEAPLLAQWTEGASDRLEAAAELVRPVIRTVSYLLYQEELKGEPHEQNIYYELDRTSHKPTGKVYVKDLDSFRVDSELRLRQGKSLAGLREIFKPFVYSKYAKASGTGGAGGVSFDQTSYYTYIKKTFGYSFCKVFRCTPTEERRLMEAFDRITAQEVSAVTGLPVNPRTLAVSLEDSPSGLSLVAERWRANLNETIHYDLLSDAWKAPAVQRALRENYLKLRGLKRASATLDDLRSDRVYFILHPDAIEARSIDPATRAEFTAGLASLYPEDNELTLGMRARLLRLGIQSRSTIPTDCEAKLLRKAG